MRKHLLKKEIARHGSNRSSWIYFLFFFSGISSLIYQIVWTRMLTLVFGHTIYSVSVVLSAFMAGLGLGSYLWGKTIDKTGKPLLIYGKIEILIGITAAVLSFLLPNFPPIYAWLHQWLPSFLFLLVALKTVLTFLLVLIPTILMGATLPIMCKYYVTDETNLGKNVSYLYAINTLGAAIGCLIAGYFLIGSIGVLQTALLAAVLNVFIGVICIIIFKKSEPEFTCGFSLPKPIPLSFQFDKKNNLWLTVSFLCGFTALAYEVVWTRLLVFSMGSTVYSFSLMLANFLFGITMGGLLIVPFFKKKIDFRLLLALFQIGIGFYLIFSLYQSNWLLSSFIRPFLPTKAMEEFWINFRNASGLMFVPTVLFGMSFPVLTHLVTKGSQDIGSSMGTIYGANTFGGVLGSIVAGYLLLPNFGSQQTLSCFAILNISTGMLIFITSSLYTGFIRKAVVTALSGLALLLLLEMPNDLLSKVFLRDSGGNKNLGELIYFEEGLTTTVAVFSGDYDKEGYEVKRKSLVLNGVSMSGTILTSRKYMTLLSYIPLLLIENPKNVLVICFGVGTTAGSAGVYPGIDLVDSVDISPDVFRSGMLFRDTNYNVLNNPKVQKIIQDGRNHLLTTSTTYDVITSEPPPPSSAGSVNLYTKEYYELAKRALKPGGIVSQWIPLHSQAEIHIYENFHTFLEVFPYTMAWYPVPKELILIGSNRPININFNQIEQHYQNPVISKIMRDIELPNAFSFLGDIWFLKKELEHLGSDQQVISDNNPTLEFYLNFPKFNSKDLIERLITNRAPFESVLTKISNLSEAEKDTLKAHWDWRIKEKYAYLYRSYGLTLMKKGDLDKSLDYFEKAVGINPTDAVAYFNIGSILEEKGELERAITQYRKAIEHKSTFAIAHNNIGNILTEKGELEGAVISYRTAIKVRPNFFEAYYNLGNVFGRQGQFLKAQKNFEEAIKLDEKQSLPHYGIGIIFKQSRQYSKAIEAFEKAISLNPKLERAHGFLEEIFDEMGKDLTDKDLEKRRAWLAARDVD